MCLIGIAYKTHPQFELVIAANRDEFHARPTAAAAWWSEAPDVFGGRDLSQGGGWLALSRRRRLAAVTNVRRMQPPDPAAPSRGRLVADFVRGADRAADFAAALSAQADRYAGFNLLLWDGRDLMYATNQQEFHSQDIAPGVHGISNAALDTPWPKLRRLNQRIADWTRREGRDENTLFAELGAEQPAADAELPNTGVGLELERFLSPPFIRGERYGTRASSVLLIGASQASFQERRYGPNGVALGETAEDLRFY